MNGDENVKEKNVDEQDKIGTSEVFFFFLQRANLIGPSHKKRKLWRVPNIEGSILKYTSFGPPIQVKGGQHLAKPTG
jgi:hypothetical protein